MEDISLALSSQFNPTNLQKGLIIPSEAQARKYQQAQFGRLLPLSN